MREPDLKGHASAWKMKLSDRSRPDYDPAWEATLVHFLMDVPFAHPFWHQYCVVGMHLRDIPGVKPAHKQFEHAGYEIMILALDPKQKHDPDLLDSGPKRSSAMFSAPASTNCGDRRRKQGCWDNEES